MPVAQPAAFQNGVWSRTCPDVLVFDDVFVDRTVYSGLDVAAEHRQKTDQDGLKMGLHMHLFPRICSEVGLHESSYAARRIIQRV